MIDFIKQKIDEYKTNDKMREVVVYLFFGVLATMVSFASFTILLNSFPQTNKDFLNVISIIITVIFAYFTNRTYVFKSTSKNILQESLKFFGSRAFSMVVEIILFYVFATLLKIQPILSKLVVTVIVIILNYFTSKIIVFRKKEEPVSPSTEE